MDTRPRLDDIPRRLTGGPRSALVGLDYFELVAIFQPMAEQDSRFVFDSLRPLGDEFWNLIDDERSFGEIAEMLLLQFDFHMDRELLLPLAAALIRAGLIEVVDTDTPATEGDAA